MKITGAIVFMTLLGLLGSGCASTPTRGVSGSTRGIEAQEAAMRLAEPETIPIFAGDTGESMAWSELVKRASEADVVLIGEMHGHPVGLAIAAALFDQIVKRNPSSSALSLEFFNRDSQIAIDDYLSGVTDSAGFEKAAGRAGTNYPPGHRAMVEAAKDAGAPVYASNAPRRYVHLANVEGVDRLESLSDEQRRLFVLPSELTEGRYQERFFEIMNSMGGHGGSDESAKTDEEIAKQKVELHKRIAGMFRSQNVWDATMAHTIAHGFATGRRPIVHVVGQFHVDFEGGLVQRLRALAPGATILTISMAADTGAQFIESNIDRADVVIHVGE